MAENTMGKEENAGYGFSHFRKKFSEALFFMIRKT